MVLAAAGLPAVAAAQQDPMARLAEVLPEPVSERVLERVAAARSRELPERAVANLVLEGIAKGRSAEEVLAAVELLLADMTRAQQALQAGGHEPAEGEVEAATTAMRMGVDGASVSELARSGPSGRSLTIPLLVLGGLTVRGLPSDDALTAVRDRMVARANDDELLRTLPELGGGLGRGRPDVLPPGLAGGAPVGPQQNRGRPEGRGRGGGPGN
jgi:hypothetical protein